MLPLLLFVPQYIYCCCCCCWWQWRWWWWWCCCRCCAAAFPIVEECILKYGLFVSLALTLTHRVASQTPHIFQTISHELIWWINRFSISISLWMMMMITPTKIHTTLCIDAINWTALQNSISTSTHSFFALVLLVLVHFILFYYM